MHRALALVLGFVAACSCDGGNAGYIPPPCNRCVGPDGPCVDLESDPENCGACGVACGGDRTCSAGTCLARCEGAPGFLATPEPRPIFSFDENGQGPGPGGDGVAPNAYALADVDGDGRTDLILPRWNTGGIVVHPGTTEGTFGPGVVSLAEHPIADWAMVAGPFGPGGELRLLVPSFDEGILLAAPSGGLGFEFVSVVSPRENDGLLAGDFDGDGDLDLLSRDAGEFLRRVYRNQGDDRFEPAGGSDLNYREQFVADLDADGRSDLVAFTGAEILLSRGDGSGGFLDPVAILAVPEVGVPGVGDLDGDGRLELLFSATREPQPLRERWRLLVYGADAGAWELRADVEVDAAGSLAAADLDGDGRDEVVVGGGNLIADRHAGLASQGWFDTGLPGDGLAPGLVDVDGDGRLDLVVLRRDGRVTVLRGDGAGDFLGTRLLGREAALGAAVLDANGDGRLDLASIQGSLLRDEGNRLVLRHGRSGRGFDLADAIDFGGGPAQLVVADLDGAGPPELVVANRNLREVTTFSVADGSLESRWSGSLDPWSEEDWGSFLVEDLDGDGKRDLAFFFEGTLLLRVFPGNGDGTFGPALHFEWDVTCPPDGPRAFPWGPLTSLDVDGDGRRDLVFGDSSEPRLAWIANRGGLAFAWGGFLPVDVVGGAKPLGPVILERGGPAELLVEARGPSFEGQPNGLLRVRVEEGQLRSIGRLDIPEAQGWFTAVGAGDLDGDGDGDILAANSWEGLDLLRQEPAGTFASTHLPMPSVVSQLPLADLDGDGRLDAAVPVAFAQSVGFVAQLYGTCD